MMQEGIRLETLSYWIGMAGTVPFAVTVVLALAPKGINLFGAAVLGVITAIGGGTSVKNAASLGPFCECGQLCVDRNRLRDTPERWLVGHSVLSHLQSCGLRHGSVCGPLCFPSFNLQINCEGNAALNV